MLVLWPFILMFFLILAAIIAILILLAIWLQPLFIIVLLEKWYPNVKWRAKTTKKVISLTIDDSPSADTPKLLDLLRQYKAKATFFCIGSHIKAHPDIAERIIRDGHEIGNHMLYDRASIKLSEHDFERELLETQNIIDEVKAKIKSNSNVNDDNNNAKNWFRPGSGFFSKKMIEQVRKHGMILALGSVYPHDPQIRSAWHTSFHIRWRVYPGAVVIIHDRKYTVPAMKEILEDLYERNYECTTLSNLCEIESKS